MRIEFLNINNDAKLDPEIKAVALSQSSESKPPSYCLPWVEATRCSIQLKANFEYWIRKGDRGIEACAVSEGKPLPVQELWLEVPGDLSFVPKDDYEKENRVISVGHTPAFSSPWQSQQAHSITLKLGICWWTPPGWGLLITSAVHRNEDFRVVEGFVRTDLWHRDIPVIIQPLVPELKLQKYSVIASALLLPVENLDLAPFQASEHPERVSELVGQISSKRLNESYYKILVSEKGRKDEV